MKNDTKNKMSYRADDGVRTACCGRAQKIWGVIALAGLFACGWMVGSSINNWRSNGAVAAETNPAPVATNAQSKDTETCALIESMLESELIPEDDMRIWAHQENIEIYNRLIVAGCPENVEKYRARIARENAIVAALDGRVDNASTCERIERQLSNRIYFGDVDSNAHIDNAKVYAVLAERGCPENSDKYIALAKQELELARALEDDNFSDSETIDVVETYKRLNMQAAAEDILDKVKKLTNPAIDFILQVEKIIKE